MLSRIAMQTRIVLSLLALFAIAIVTTAQRPSRSGLGYMGGPQMATWHSEAVNYRPVAGFVAGIYVPIWAGRSMEIQPDLLLSLQGAAQELPDDGSSTMRNLRAVLPVSLKVFFGRTFNIQAGVQSGYLLMAKADGTDIRDQVSPLDMGLNIGAGIGTTTGLDLTLRYYSGLTNTLVEDKHFYPSNRTLQFTAGYRFMQFSRQRQRH